MKEREGKGEKKERASVLRDFLKDLEGAYPDMAAAANTFLSYSRKYPEFLEDLRVAFKGWLDRVSKADVA